MELYLPPKPKKKYKILWSEKMLEIIKEKFSFTFNRELAKELNVSMRTLIRKARELNLEKEPDFLDKNRETITKMAVANNYNKYTGVKGWSVPNSEMTRFKPGQSSLMKFDRDLVARVHKTRNETIKRERIRMRLGLSRLTNLKLK